MELIIGPRLYSTWSLRPWLVLKRAGIPFEEVKIQLRQGDETAAQIGAAAVLATIGDAVTPGEFDDVLSQLGREYAALAGTVS